MKTIFRQWPILRTRQLQDFQFGSRSSPFGPNDGTTDHNGSPDVLTGSSLELRKTDGRIDFFF
jgi:hypothetical protein